MDYSCLMVVVARFPQFRPLPLIVVVAGSVVSFRWLIGPATLRSVALFNSAGRPPCSLRLLTSLGVAQLRSAPRRATPRNSASPFELCSLSFALPALLAPLASRRPARFAPLITLLRSRSLRSACFFSSSIFAPRRFVTFAFQLSSSCTRPRILSSARAHFMLIHFELSQNTFRIESTALSRPARGLPYRSVLLRDEQRPFHTKCKTVWVR